MLTVELAGTGRVDWLMGDIRAGGQAVSHLDTHAHVQAKREELADDVRAGAKRVSPLSPSIIKVPRVSSLEP